MWRFIVASITVVVVGVLVAAPVPPERPAKALAEALSDPDVKVRNESAAALRDRADARPWLRRAARSADQDTVRSATALLTLHAEKRQTAAAPDTLACVRECRRARQSADERSEGVVFATVVSVLAGVFCASAMLTEIEQTRAL